MGVLDYISGNGFFDKSSGGEMIPSAANQPQYVVVCGFCGAVEKHIGPRKTECPNCDEDIY